MDILTPMNDIQEKLKMIKPGKTYPQSVRMFETYKGQTMKVDFFCQSYMVGMYCAIHINGRMVSQTGERNNKSFTAKLKKDVKAAMERGATVEIGAIVPIKES